MPQIYWTNSMKRYGTSRAQMCWNETAEQSQVQVLSINKTHVYISYFYLVGKAFDDIDSIFHVTQKFVFLRDHVTNFNQSNHLKWVFCAENNKHPQNKDSKQYFLPAAKKKFFLITK